MMLFLNEQRCDGCGACLDVCPTGAIRVADGMALKEPDEVGPFSAATTDPVMGRSQQRAAPLRSLAGVALAFIGQQVLPQVASAVLQFLAQRRPGASVEPTANGRQAMAPRAGNATGGRRRAHRRRGNPD